MAVRIVVSGGSSRSLFSRREHKKMAALLKVRVIPVLKITSPGEAIPQDYPWCFVLPTAERKRYFIGALVAGEAAQEASPVFALYAKVTAPWLDMNLQSHFHIGFWLSRIMLALQKQDGIFHEAMTLQTWLESLQCSYSPLREFFLHERYKFRNNSDLLLSGLSTWDEKLSEQKGVTVMPWKEWPDCLQTEQQAWLWRQSRHGKIIDSQKVLL